MIQVGRDGQKVELKTEGEGSQEAVESNVIVRSFRLMRDASSGSPRTHFVKSLGWLVELTEEHAKVLRVSTKPALILVLRINSSAQSLAINHSA